MTEAGVPDRGFLTVTYYSGEGMKKEGCRPLTDLRRALLHLTNTCREEDVERRWDGTGGPDEPSVDTDRSDALRGVKYIRTNEMAWRTYMLA